MGALLPVAALKGIRELADPRGEGTNGVAHQVFGRKRAADLVARSRAADLQATAVATSDASDRVITVHQTAKAAASLSAGFAQGESLQAGTLSFAIDGRDYSVGIARGASLGDVAEAIRGTGADVDASVSVEDGQQRLSLVRRSTGYLTSLGAESALSIRESFNGGEGRTLDLAPVQTAQNARVTVDQQTIERRSNTISDAVPGTTLRIDENTGRSQVLEGRDAATLSRGGSVSAFTVSVQQIAAAAEARSTEFASPYDQVQGGNVLIKVDGGQYWIPVNEGASLMQTAASINASGAPVQASLQRQDTGVSLAITAKQTGFEPGTNPGDALQVSFEATGSAGKSLTFAVVRQAQNAQVSLNGQAIESRSNELASAAGIPRLSLKEPTSAPQTQGAAPDPTKLSERPTAAAQVARLLQEQVVALVAQPVEAGVAAAQAKKLYAAVDDKTAGPASKATAKLKPQDKPTDANASRSASPTNADGANSVLASALAESANEAPVEAVAPVGAEDTQPQKGALGALLEQLKNGPPKAERSKPSPYAPPNEETKAGGFSKESLYASHRHALGRKAKHAYAQHAA